jgi:hypothetical protein
MSPSSSPVLHSRRPRRPPRPSRGRNRPPQRIAMSRSRVPAIRAALIVTAVWSIATGTYFAFSGDVLTRLLGGQQITDEDHIAELRARVDSIVSGQFLDQKQVEQQLTALLQRQATLEQRTSALTSDLSATGTIRPERIAPIEATPAEKAPAVAPKVTSATTKPDVGVAHHRASLRHRVARIAPPGATPAEKAPAVAPKVTSATTKPGVGVAHHRASLRHRVARIAPPGATPAEKAPAVAPKVTSATTKPDAGVADQ